MEPFTLATSSHLNRDVKIKIIESAKEWPLYFCRLFPVTVIEF